MSGPGPGSAHRVVIEIQGPRSTKEIKKCMDEIREAIKHCGGRIAEQSNVQDPLSIEPQLQP